MRVLRYIAPPWRLFLGGLAATLVALGVAWSTWVGPLAPAPPEDVAAIDESRDHRVFAYGTLRHAAVRLAVVGRPVPTSPAVLPGYERRGLDVAPKPGGRTEGVVFTVQARELRRLDRYERIGVRYERVKRSLEDGTRAWVYRRLPRPTPSG